MAAFVTTRRYCSLGGEIGEGLRKHMFVQAMQEGGNSVARAHSLAERFGVEIITETNPPSGLESFGVLQVLPERLQLCYFITSLFPLFKALRLA